jgi:hypothetical protein
MSITEKGLFQNRGIDKSVLLLVKNRREDIYTYLPYDKKTTLLSLNIH